MHYLQSLDAIQQRLQPVLPLSDAQVSRISLMSYGLLLAKNLHLSFIARVLPQPTQQDSRIRWISRLLVAPFMQIELVYHPLLRDLFSKLRQPKWHVVIDRTPWIPQTTDLLIISLSYHKRAIPIVWFEVPYGGTALAVAVELLMRCHALIPKDASVIFHGDTEFGGREMIAALQYLGWDFILAQTQSTHIWLPDATASMPLNHLDLPKKGACRIANVRLLSKNPISNLNLVAFPQVKRDRYGHIKREICYLVTSLPPHSPLSTSVGDAGELNLCTRITNQPGCKSQIPAAAPRDDGRDYSSC